MNLPNSENAVVDLEKLTEYCLSKDHPRGKHKARVFESVCGFTVENAEALRLQFLEAAVNVQAIETASDHFGRRFVIKCSVTGPRGIGLVRTGWIVRRDEDFPRFVTAYVVQRADDE